MVEDYYDLLGVDHDASEDAILEAYRRRAAEHHPDVSDEEGAGETFQQLNRAKAVLTDEDRRRAYDRLGHERYLEREAGTGGADADSGSRADVASEHTPRRSGDGRRGPGGVGGSLFETVFGRDPWRSFLGGFGRSRGHPATGSNAATFDVDLESVFRREGPWLGGRSEGAEAGGQRGSTTTEVSTCPKCDGRGTFLHTIDTGRGRTRRTEPCERCEGTGTVTG